MPTCTRVPLVTHPPQAAPVVVVGAADGAVSAYSLAEVCSPLDAPAAASGDDAAREEGRRRLEAALRLHTAQQHGAE